MSATSSMYWSIWSQSGRWRTHPSLLALSFAICSPRSTSSGSSIHSACPHSRLAGPLNRRSWHFEWTSLSWIVSRREWSQESMRLLSRSWHQCQSIPSESTLAFINDFSFDHPTILEDTISNLFNLESQKLDFISYFTSFPSASLAPPTSVSNCNFELLSTLSYYSIIHPNSSASPASYWSAFWRSVILSLCRSLWYLLSPPPRDLLAKSTCQQSYHILSASDLSSNHSLTCWCSAQMSVRPCSSA